MVSYGNTMVFLTCTMLTNNSNIIVLVKLCPQFKTPKLNQGNELAQHSHNLSKTRDELQKRGYL